MAGLSSVSRNSSTRFFPTRTTTAVAVALAHLRRRLIAVSGLPADVDDTMLARAAAGRAGQSPESLAALLARAVDAARGPLAAAAAVSVVRALQDASRTVDCPARGGRLSR